MSDIYIPGVRSRFNTDQMIEGLMRVEREPLDRTNRDIEQYNRQKTWWQDISRRMTALRDSSRLLYSFQNPFSERIVSSQDPQVITGTATREALEQERNFQVRQIAKSDRFISKPLPENYRVEAGDYTFAVGNQEISFHFRGGTLRDFTENLNRRGQNTVQASLVNVERGSRSLLIESLVTGEANRLSFRGSAESLVLGTGMVERQNDSRRDVDLAESSIRVSGENSQYVTARGGRLDVSAGGGVVIPVSPAINTAPNLALRFELATDTQAPAGRAEMQPPPGPEIPQAGSVTYGGITIDNDAHRISLPPWEPPPPPVRIDEFSVISLLFQDGTRAAIPPIHDSDNFETYQYRLMDLTGGKPVSGISIQNTNTNRNISVRNIVIQDPDSFAGLKPLNPVSTAQDAVLSMEGIEIRRPSNNIDDLIPGVTLNLRGASDREVRVDVTPDREAIKEAIINLVGNYNRLMAEANILTRRDERVIQELSYLETEEQEAYRERLGAFAGDTTLNSFRSSLQRTVSAPYPTEAGAALSLLRQIGIGADLRGGTASTGYDPSRLRGYLEIDERVLDEAIQTKLPAIRQLFGRDTDGDLLVDTGIAFNLEQLTRPYVETGGIISLKTGTLDSRISRDTRRAETLERQLASRESRLRTQYAQMESAYSQMERQSTALDNFSRQANANSNANGR